VCVRSSAIDLSKVPGGSTDAMQIMAAVRKLLPPEGNGEHTLVDAAIDCVGYECCGAGKEGDKRISEQVLNTCFTLVKAGGQVGVPGIYPVSAIQTASATQLCGEFAFTLFLRFIPPHSVPWFSLCSLVSTAQVMDPSGAGVDYKKGVFHLQYGLSWNKGQAIAQGQCPVMKFNLELMKGKQRSQRQPSHSNDSRGERYPAVADVYAFVALSLHSLQPFCTTASM
jgi:hypothetical protein